MWPGLPWSLTFGSGYERVEVIPAYLIESVGDNLKYSIPGVTSEWMQSTPEAHLAHVNQSNILPAKENAKALARLLKAWKYYRSVPVSSFYLEMRAAAYTRRQSTVVYWIDLYILLQELLDIGLASMNDPTGTTGRIQAYSSEALGQDAISKLNSAVIRARKAYDAALAGYDVTVLTSTDPHFQPVQLHHGAFDIGDTLLVPPIGSQVSLSTIEIYYATSYVMSMLARYRLSDWLAVWRGEKGDNARPVFERAMDLIQEQYLRVCADLMNVATS
jgi:hypothetical protein